MRQHIVIGQEGSLLMLATNRTVRLELNVGCGPHYADGWWNIDAVRSDEHNIHPDEVVDPRHPFQTVCNVERLMLSHVLEHVPWGQVVPFLQEARAACVSGAQVCVVGPDVYRALERWKAGVEPWSILASCLEHAGGALDDSPLRHHWNCEESRVVDVLTVAGWRDIVPQRMGSTNLDEWPVISRAEWQFAILARA